MKIRNGFVSNSSSSSFILKFDETYPDTISIAESMLKNKFDEWIEYDDVDEGDPIINRSYKNVQHFKKNSYDPYTPIFFRSCNYDTFIVPITKDYVFVDTCNNTHWDIEDDGFIVHDIPDEVMEKYPDSEGYGRSENYIVYPNRKDEYDEGVSIKYDTEFFLVEEGIFMTSPGGYETCTNKGCWHEVWYFNGKKYCMRCDENTLKRALKIKKIKNAFTQD